MCPYDDSCPRQSPDGFRDHCIEAHVDANQDYACPLCSAAEVCSPPSSHLCAAAVGELTSLVQQQLADGAERNLLGHLLSVHVYYDPPEGFVSPALPPKVPARACADNS